MIENESGWVANLIMIYNGKKKQHRKNREFGNMQEWRLLMGGMKVEVEGWGLGDWGDECLVNWGDGERFMSQLSPTFS